MIVDHPIIAGTQRQAVSPFANGSGCHGDGVTDDRLLIQATIDAAALTCKSVYLPPATYAVSNGLSFSTQGMEFYGVYLQSIISTTSATNDIIDVDASFTYIHDLQLASSVAPNRRSFYQHSQRHKFNQTIRPRVPEPLYRDRSAGRVVSILDVANCTFYGAVANVGIGIQIESGLEIRLRHILMNSASSPDLLPESRSVLVVM